MGDSGAMRMDDGVELTPEDAAALLRRTERDARRRFDHRSPWITAVMGALVLGAYVTLWVSTRDQHPYAGPSLPVIGLVFAVVIVSAIVASMLLRRATSGVAGPSGRRRTVLSIALAFSVAGSPLIQGAMKSYGASDAIVYGVIPAAGPLVVIGTTMVAVAAVREDRAQLIAAVVLTIAGFVALFSGPSAAWLVAGIGFFLAVEGYAALQGRAAARPV